MSLKATEVFVPGSYPQHTYVERAGQRLEQSLHEALGTPGQVVSLAGPSKSGKIVPVEGRGFALTGGTFRLSRGTIEQTISFQRRR
jgi:hypothetical protein